MSWIYLASAILFEVCGTTCMKLAEGFTKGLPSVLVLCFYGASFMSLGMALKKMDVSLAYAIWSGLGTVLITAVGSLWFHEPMTVAKIVSIGLIIMGVVGLNLSGGAH